MAFLFRNQEQVVLDLSPFRRIRFHLKSVTLSVQIIIFMAASLNINNILLQVKQLHKDEQLTLLEKIIRLMQRPEPNDSLLPIDSVMKYKGAMSSQPLEIVDEQLRELRSEWE
jgi:hypothetical protein